MSFKKFMEKYFDQTCKACGHLRKELKFEALPKEIQIAFKQLLTGKEDFYFCGNCQEYTVAKDVRL